MDEEKLSYNKMYIFLNFITITATIAIIFFLSYYNVAPVSKNQEELKSLEFLIVLSRHGARAPMFSYPLDTFEWPNGKASLTSKGKMQMYKMGQVLRERYGTFYDYTYHKENIHIQSTNSSRTKISAEILVAGMFPPEHNLGSKSQPIQIWTDESDKSKITFSTSMCPKYGSERDTALHSVEYFLEDKDLNNYLAKHTGQEITYLNFLDIWDSLNCLAENDYPLPSWSKSVYPEKMKTVVEKIFNVLVAVPPEATSLIAGQLFKDLDIRIMKKFANHTSDKMLIHNGHDFTIQSLLYVVGFNQVQLIPPAAMLILEVHKSLVHKHVIKMLFYNTTNFDNVETIEPWTFNMPKCNNTCPLTKFLSVLRDFEIDNADWNSKCNEP